MNQSPPRHPSLSPRAGTAAIDGFNNSTFEVRPCALGLGLFAARPIQPGELILAFGGNFISFAETKARGEWECMPLQVGRNRYIDTAPPGVFVNHSCDPNAGIAHDRDLIALRAIAPGEEIRFDYSTTMLERSFTMRCLCGSPACRGLIEDFDRIPPEQQQAYLGQRLVMRFIAEQTTPQLGPK